MYPLCLYLQIYANLNDGPKYNMCFNAFHHSKLVWQKYMSRSCVGLKKKRKVKSLDQKPTHGVLMHPLRFDEWG